LTECRKTPEKGQKHCEDVDSKNDREALKDQFSVSHFVLFFKTIQLVRLAFDLFRRKVWF